MRVPDEVKISALARLKSPAALISVIIIYFLLSEFQILLQTGQDMLDQVNEFYVKYPVFLLQTHD